MIKLIPFIKVLFVSVTTKFFITFTRLWLLFNCGQAAHSLKNKHISVKIFFCATGNASKLMWLWVLHDPFLSSYPWCASKLLLSLNSWCKFRVISGSFYSALSICAQNCTFYTRNYCFEHLLHFWGIFIWEDPLEESYMMVKVIETHTHM